LVAIPIAIRIVGIAVTENQTIEKDQARQNRQWDGFLTSTLGSFEDKAGVLGEARWRLSAGTTAVGRRTDVS
jgi:hypothetical protein